MVVHVAVIRALWLFALIRHLWQLQMVIQGTVIRALWLPKVDFYVSFRWLFKALLLELCGYAP